MANIVKFPRVKRDVPKDSPAAPPKVEQTKNAPLVVQVIHVAIVLLSPLLKWVLSLDCVFQLLRTMFYWNTPGVHAGWTFLLHFAALFALNCYVAFYTPKGL